MKNKIILFNIIVIVLAIFILKGCSSVEKKEAVKKPVNNVKIEDVEKEKADKYDEWVKDRLNRTTTTIITDVKRNAIDRKSFKHIERKHRIENKDLVVYFKFRIDGQEKEVDYKVKYPSGEVENRE